MKYVLSPVVTVDERSFDDATATPVIEILCPYSLVYE